MIDYEVIATGSSGNCVLIGDIMIDVGVPFKKIKDRLYDVNVILLTHVHTDHVKESTLKNIIIMFPHVEIYGNFEVVQYFREYPIKVVNSGYPFKCQNNILIEAFPLVHDVVTTGYTWEVDNQSIIYATDTSSMDYAPKDRQYDYFFLESNHDEKKLEQLANTRSFGYNVISSAKRHLSTQQAKSFYYMFRKSKDSKFIELHQSSRFY